LARYGKIKPMKAPLTLIVGLGNPGDDLAHTYHNVGAEMVTALAPQTWKTYKKLFRYASAGNVAFVVPLTFMNGSGVAVKEAMKKFGARPADLIIVHDESDLALGSYKISSGQGAAGHKGVQSIIDAIHTKDFMRVRIGIRPASEVRRKKAEEFVLAKVKPGDVRILQKVFVEIEEELKIPREE
jgi:peptidyl-tRNA hydrolase, PTH1 family